MSINDESPHYKLFNGTFDVEIFSLLLQIYLIEIFEKIEMS